MPFLEKVLNVKRKQDQSQEAKDMVVFVRDTLESWRLNTTRITQESVALTNIAYLTGYDSVYFDSVQKQFRPVHYPSNFLRKNRVHYNKILPTIQTRLSMLMRSPPRYDVLPNSMDEDDKDRARLSKALLEQLWDECKINQQRAEMLMYMQQCGHAYFKACWDTERGRKKILKDGDRYHLVTEGDIRVGVSNFFEMFTDPLAKRWMDVDRIIEAKLRPLRYFRDYYGNGHLIKAEDAWLNSLSYELKLPSFSNQSAAMGMNIEAMKNSAIEISYMEAPSKRHPLGKHIIIANDVQLKDGTLPIDELPYAKFDDIIIGGKFNSESTISHLRPLQDQLNRNLTTRSAWMNKLCHGKFLHARGHNLQEGALDDQSGEKVAYEVVPNAPPPAYLQVPSIPSYAYKEDETLNLAIDDISGVNQQSRGQMPSASIPAIGMQLLVELDASRIAGVTEMHEYGYADLGRIMLKFACKNYKTTRLVRMLGENMQYALREVTGEALKDHYNVRVIRGSTLPGSKVLKRQEIINLHQQGYFGPPQDPTVIENVLSQLEYGDETRFWKKQSIVKQQIYKAIDLIEKQGIKPVVSEFDKHHIWFDEFNDYRMSEKYERLNTQQKLIVMEVLEEHLMFMTEMTQPNTIEDQETNPGLQPETDASQMESELLQEGEQRGFLGGTNERDAFSY